MSLLKKLAGETIIYGLGSMLPRIINFLIISMYLTRVFEKQEYGIYGIMYSFAALLILVFTFRMETALFRFGKDKKDLSHVFGTASIPVFLVSITFAGLIICFSGPIAETLTTGSDQRFVVWFAIISLFDAISALPFAKLRLQGRAKYFTILKLVNVFVTVVIILTFLGLLPWLSMQGIDWVNNIYNSSKELDYVFLANLIASGMVLLLLLREYRGIKWNLDKPLFSRMFKYALPLIIVGLAGVINQLLDRWLIKEFTPDTLGLGLGTEMSGIYNGCIKIAVIMAIFTTAFNYAAEPFFFKNSDRKDAKTVYGEVALAYSLCACLIFLFISLFIDQFKLLIDSEYHLGIGIVPIVLMAYLFLGLFYNFSIWYKLQDKTTFGAVIGIVGSIITITLNILLIPKIGYYGSAWASLACFVTMSALAYISGQKYYAIKYPIKRILGYILFSGCLYIFSFEVFSENGGAFKLLGNLGLLLFFIVVVFNVEKRTIRLLFGQQ